MVFFHYGKTGHEKDKCFDLHGVPDWYTGLRGSRSGRVGRGGRHGIPSHNAFAVKMGGPRKGGVSDIQDVDRTLAFTLT